MPRRPSFADDHGGRPSQRHFRNLFRPRELTLVELAQSRQRLLRWGRTEYVYDLDDLFVQSIHL